MIRRHSAVHAGPEDPELKLRALGTVALSPGRVTQPKLLLLLCYLAAERSATRAQLRKLLWPERDEAANNLRVALSALRRAHPELLSERGDQIYFEAQSDVEALTTALQLGSAKEVLGSYAGAFMEDFPLSVCSPELEEWLLGTRESLAEQVRSVILRQAEESLARQELQQAAAQAEWVWTLPGAPPCQEGELRQLYRLLELGGSPLSAQVRREARELGLTLAGLPAPAPTAATPISGRSLPPEPGAFVGRRAVSAQLERALVDRGTRLITVTGPGGIGKSRLALHLAHRAQESGAWSLVGFCPLEEVSGVSQLLPALTHGLGLSVGPGATALSTLRSALRHRPALLVLDGFDHLVGGAEVIRALLTDVPSLRLLVTSRERLRLQHEVVAELGGLELRTAPGQRLSEAATLFAQQARRVVLGRELSPAELRAADEVCALLDGMPLAIELAAAWIRLLSPEQIAQELRSGLELLEMPVRDLPERHRNLRAVFDQSWALLSDAERRVLSDLAVFHGGFTRQAAAEVTGASLHSLLALVDKSLLKVDERGRYQRHPLVAQRSRERLFGQAGHDRALEARHAAYFTAQSSAAFEALMCGADALTWTEWVRSEWANLQAALRASAARGEHETVVWLCRNLLRECASRGLLPELAQTLQRSLPHVRALGGRVRAWGELSAEALAPWPPQSRPVSRESGLVFARQTGDRLAVLFGLSLLDCRAQLAGDTRRSAEIVDELVRLALITRQPGLEAAALQRRGSLALWQGRLRAAREDLERSAALLLSEASSVRADSLVTLAQVRLLSGEVLGAEAQLQEALGHYRALAYLPEMTVCHANLALAGLLSGARTGLARAWAELEQADNVMDARRCPALRGQVDARGCLLALTGPVAEAERWLAEEVALAEQGGHQSRLLIARLNQGSAALRAQAWSQARARFETVVEPLWDRRGGAALLMLGLYGLAHAAWGAGDPDAAAALLGAAERVCRETGAQLAPRLSCPVRRLRRQLEARLGETGAQQAQRRGQVATDWRQLWNSS